MTQENFTKFSKTFFHFFFKLLRCIIASSTTNKPNLTSLTNPCKHQIIPTSFYSFFYFFFLLFLLLWSSFFFVLHKWKIKSAAAPALLPAVAVVSRSLEPKVKVVHKTINKKSFLTRIRFKDYRFNQKVVQTVNSNGAKQNPQEEEFSNLDKISTKLLVCLKSSRII